MEIDHAKRQEQQASPDESDNGNGSPASPPKPGKKETAREKSEREYAYLKSLVVTVDVNRIGLTHLLT